MALAAPSGNPVLCHQDLLFENMIRTASGIVVVDWEYARLADPAYDLAVFTTTYSVNDHQRKMLLDAYRSTDSGLPERILYYEKVYALIEILWWQIKGRRLDEQIQKLAGLLASD
jgi:thiamine kinase-like enzyme